MTGALHESAAAPTSHSATDPAEFNVVCCSKSDLPNRTDSNAALLPYLTHQLGSAHEWSAVWNGPQYSAISCCNRFQWHKEQKRTVLSQLPKTRIF